LCYKAGNSSGCFVNELLASTNIINIDDDGKYKSHVAVVYNYVGYDGVWLEMYTRVVDDDGDELF